MEAFWIWVGFAVGLLIQSADRIEHVITADPNHTILGFLRNNYGRLIIRVVSNAAVFYYVVLPTGWVVAPPIAFTIGLSFDRMAESLLDRAKKRGEAMVSKIKNGGGG